MKQCVLMGWPKSKTKEKRFPMSFGKLGAVLVGEVTCALGERPQPSSHWDSATQLTNVLFPTTNTAFVNLAGGFSRNG